MGSQDRKRRLSVPTGLYDAMYRVGYTAWEHPGEAWTSSLARWLDLEEAERDRPPPNPSSPRSNAPEPRLTNGSAETETDH